MSGATFQLYVKATSNYQPGLGLQSFERLGSEWAGDNLTLPFGEGDEARPFEVVGWTDLFGGRPCPVHVVKARWLGQAEDPAFLVYGGNSGLRILDAQASPQAGIDDHLPPGYGRPVVWVKDPADLPPEVLAVVGDLDGPPPPVPKRGDFFTLGELASPITGGNLRAMARLLNDAGLFPQADEYATDPGQAVPRVVVIDLVAQRAGDRVGRKAAELLSETMGGER